MSSSRLQQPELLMQSRMDPCIHTPLTLGINIVLLHTGRVFSALEPPVNRVRFLEDQNPFELLLE